MRFRSIILAGAAVLALSAPAAASDATGWYLGLGAGWDTSQLVHSHWAGPPAGSATAAFHDDALGTVSFGYKWDANIRAEIEGGYDERALVKTPNVAGGLSVTSGLFNVIYDIPVADWFTISLGGGAGIGSIDPHIKRADAGYLIHGSNAGFMWQGIAGVSVPVAENMDFYVDWRYRRAEVDHNFASDTPVLDPIHVNNVTENVALVGTRWYLEPPAPPPPPPPPMAPPPPPPPPPAMPCPVKTYIVFFDFDKSNLTDSAQQVVVEAVKATKEGPRCGFVKVLITGHTDTVGSDRYNQALSERRAGAVKDEMVREGVDGGTIAIEGKSFHDPLVPTGPGVREPQNRRAVIDLGG